MGVRGLKFKIYFVTAFYSIADERVFCKAKEGRISFAKEAYFLHYLCELFFSFQSWGRIVVSILLAFFHNAVERVLII